jgi:surface polysaccharide O-acyltransferase-like enzyme
MSRNGAIDAIKGIAIVSVLLIHSLPDKVLSASFSVFHISQAVPILVVMMGYLGATSRVRPLGDYFRRRGVRLLVPWAVAWLVALLVVVLNGDFAFTTPMLVGWLPVPNGPGNYFISIAIEFVLILPLLRWLLDRGPWVLLGACIAVDLSYELTAAYFGLNNYVTKALIFRYLFAVALGMLLARGHKVWVLFPLSFAYLVAITAGVRFEFLAPGWQSQSLLAAGYTIALVAVGLRFRYLMLLQSFGRASWHVFLVQIVWFGQIAPALVSRFGLSTAANVALGLVACLAIGLGFARAEQWATHGVRDAWRKAHPLPAP